MPNQFTVIVGGSPVLAQALASTGLFTLVVPVASTSGLRDVLQSRTLTSGVEDKIFIFADDLPVDTPQDLTLLVGKLTAMGARVLILGATPASQTLVERCPGAGLLEGVVQVNNVLGAIAGFAGVTEVRPVSEVANITILGHAPAVATQPLTSSPVFPTAFPAAFPGSGTPAPATPAWQQPPAPPAWNEEPPPPAPQPAPPVAPPAWTGQPIPGTLPAEPHLPARNPFSQTGTLVRPDTGGDLAPIPGPPADPFARPDAPPPPPPANPFAPPPAHTPAPTYPQTPGNEQDRFAPRPRPALPGVATPMTGNDLAIPANGTAGRQCKVIVITAPKGGTGKSTMSLNLAAYLGLRLRGTGKTVALIDANVQQADAGKYLNAYTPSVEDLLLDPASITPERIGQYLISKPQLNLSVLLGPATPDAANPLHFTGARYTQILNALKPNYDFIIIDTPVAEFYHDMFRNFALPNADRILVAITPNITTLVNVDLWLRQITSPKTAGGMGIDENIVGITLNRAEEGVGCSEDDVRHNLAEWRYLGAIPETKEWKMCNNRGELVATKNYHELNEAFSAVLAPLTGEWWLVGDQDLASNADTGRAGSKFRRLFRRSG